MKINEIAKEILKIDFLIMKRIISRDLLSKEVLKGLWKEAKDELHEYKEVK